MTRKRFIKLVMSYRVQRNEAAEMTKEVNRAGSYKRLFLWFLLRRLPNEFYDLPDSGSPVGAAAMAGFINEAVTGKRNPDFDPAAGALYMFYEQAVKLKGERTELPEVFTALESAMHIIASTIAGIIGKASKALKDGTITVNEARATCGLPGISPLDTKITMHHMPSGHIVPLTQPEHANIHSGSKEISFGGPVLTINIAEQSPDILEQVQRKARRDTLDSLLYSMGGLQYGG